MDTQAMLIAAVLYSETIGENVVAATKQEPAVASTAKSFSAMRTISFSAFNAGVVLDGPAVKRRIVELGVFRPRQHHEISRVVVSSDEIVVVNVLSRKKRPPDGRFDNHSVLFYQGVAYPNEDIPVVVNLALFALVQAEATTTAELTEPAPNVVIARGERGPAMKTFPRGGRMLRHRILSSTTGRMRVHGAGAVARSGFLLPELYPFARGL